MQSVNVMFRDKTARRIKADEAAALVSAGKASYISHTLYKAIQAGIPLDSIKDRRDDKSIKLQIQSITRKQRREVRQEQSEQDGEQPQRLSKAERRQKVAEMEAGR